MSLPNAIRPTEGAPPRSTRQLLEELDTLMLQMLALPVEEEPTDETPVPAKPALAATLTMIEPEAEGKSAPVPQIKPRPAAAPDMPPVHICPIPSGALEPPPVADSNSADSDSAGAVEWNVAPWDEGPADTVSSDEAESKSESSFALVDLDEEGATDTLLAADKPAPPPVKITPRRPAARPAARAAARDSDRLALGTLLIWERGFRRFTRRLGPFGLLLRTAGGRVFLGILGLVFWTISLAWLVRDWLQWPR
jgi:hypothetical protein